MRSVSSKSTTNVKEPDAVHYCTATDTELVGQDVSSLRLNQSDSSIEDTLLNKRD